MIQLQQPDLRSLVRSPSPQDPSPLHLCCLEVADCRLHCLLPPVASSLTQTRLIHITTTLTHTPLTLPVKKTTGRQRVCK
jgi:hypothetical protein